MADYFYGYARGQKDNPNSLAVGTVTNNTDIELHINTANGVTKKDIMKALEVFERFIIGNGVGTGTGHGVDLPPL